MSLLIIERGPNAGARLPLNSFPVTIGRDPTNSICLEDDEISRFHIRIKQRGRLIIVEDLESRNGTYLNGDKILNSILKNGDKLLVGSSELTFVTAESNIHLATEILNFDMIVAESMGLTGPIDVRSSAGKKNFKPVRLNQLSVMHQIPNDSKALRQIYEFHTNMLVIDDLEEASRALLKNIGQLIPGASRAAVFVWSDQTRQLLPTAAKQYKKKQAFLLSQRALEDVITRKQGILLPAQTPQVTNPGRTRVILPMNHSDKPICVIHIECDSDDAFVNAELEQVQALITRCAPSFETMLLRRELDSFLVGMIETMVATVEAKDTYTRGHSERVSRYSMAIADELKLNREIKRLLMISSLCHDIGKIGVPDAILKKASLLSAEEYNEMKLHPNIGADIIAAMPNAKRFLSGVKHHHEKWDGTGYPDGLAGEEIPFFGRIVGIADVFDAMISGRSYSGFMEQAEAVERLEEEKELFDPEILKAFIRAHETGALTQKTSTQNQADPRHAKDSSGIDLDVIRSGGGKPIKKKRKGA